MRRKLFNIFFFFLGGGGGGEASDANFNTCGGILQKMYIHACMRTHINVHMKTQDTLLNVHTPMHACMHTHMYACMHMQIHQNIYIFTFLHENPS